MVLDVDERDVAEIALGQKGYLALAGLTGEVLPMTVERITPVATARDGLSFFRVEAKLDRSPEVLRPGMEGVGKIEVDSRRQLWLYTHRLTHWWRMWIWSSLP